MEGSSLIVASLLLIIAAVAAAQSNEPGPPQMLPFVKSESGLVFAKVDVKGPDGATVKKDLVLDLYVPANVPGKRPLIVWVHGGGWVEGSRNRLWIPWVVNKGYALASIEYRLSGEALWPAQIHDCKAAVRWLRANADTYNLDASRVGAAGDSAGGHLAAMLGVTGGMKELEGDLGNLDQSSKVQAVIDFFGPADLTGMARPRSDRPASRAGGGLLGARLGDSDDPAAEAALMERARQASPITHASKDDPPFLIIHGDADPLVGIDHSRKLHAALKQAGADVTLVEIPGGKHGDPFNDFYYSVAARNRILDFFDKHLKAPQPATATAPAE